MNKKILLFILLFLAYHAKSQIQIDQSYTPQQLVQNFLIGGGLTVNNITFSGVLSSTGGTCNQIALFNNGNTTSLGMNSGIVIATGCVTDIPQPGSSFMSQDLGGPGVPDLTSLSGNTTFDGAVLEFDFVPLDAQISFTYIFGSEEYPEYVNAGYNDIFAFFITGPNPGGGNYANQNIALIPGTATPVSIDNVNAGSYAQYFIDNDGTSNQPVFDGFTTPLNAVAEVVPCQTYHLKICIADVGDGVYDSGVFLMRNSLSTDAIDITVSYSSGSGPAGEGCSTATVTATIGNAPTSPVTVNYSIGGTATNADFTQPIPTSITIPAGQTSASFTLTPVLDGLTEGVEYVVFSMPSTCGGFTTDTVYIADNSLLSVNAGLDQTLCATAMPATLTATPTGGVAPYTYLWSNSAGNTQTVSVSPASNTHYQVTVTDACGQTATDAVDVNVVPNPTSTFTATTPICEGQPVTVTYQGNASAAATYNWNFNGATILSGGTGQGPHQITWNTAGTYTITLSVSENSCNSQPSQQTITVYAAGSPNCCTMPTPYAGIDKSVCSLTTVLEANPSMAGSWTSIPATTTISQPSNPHSSVTVPTAGTYQFIWTESFSPACTNSDTVTIIFNPAPNVSASASPSSICIGTSSIITATGATNYAWNNGGNNPQTVTPASTTTYQVTGTDANNCMAVATVTVTVYPLPNVTITGNGSICQGQSTTLTGNGAVNYVWTTGFNTPSITISPITDSDYGVTGTDVYGCTNTATFHVTVIPMPIANAGNDTAICGLTYTLHAIPSVGTGTWTSTGNITINSINSPQAIITATQSGTYTLVWTENNNGCTDADSVIVQLTRIPTSTFTADTIACSGNASQINFTGISDVNSSFTWSWDGGNAIPGSGIGPHQVSWSTTGIHTVTLSVSTNGCASSTTTILLYNPTPVTTSLSKTDLLCNGASNGAVDLTVSGGRPPYTYQWSNGTPTQDLLNINGGIYTVTVTDASGCTQSNGITVNEPSKLIVSITPVQYICMSQPAYLTLTATGGTPPYTFYWNGQPSNATIAVYPTTDTYYSGYVVDANGCTSPILHTSVLVAPPVQVTLSANTNHVCPGDPVMLTTVIEGGVGPPYIIYNQEGTVVIPPIYIYPQYTNFYTVRVEDACGTWDTSGVYIYVWSLPPADALADTLQGCVPLTVHFIEVNPDSGQSYIWNFGDQSNLSLAKNPVHTYTSAGTYDVTLTVTSIHGCKTIKTYNDMVTVWPNPNARFTWFPDYVTEVEPVTNFTNLSTGALWYEWIYGDGDSSSVVNPSHRYPGAGNYNVMLIAVSNKGCRDTAIAPLKILEQFTFYAPTAFSPDGDRNNDSFYIMAHGILEEEFTLEVYDRWGEIIWSTTKYSRDNECSEKWDGRAKNHNIAPIGTYSWRAIFKDDFYKKHEKVGAITIIK